MKRKVAEQADGGNNDNDNTKQDDLVFLEDQLGMSTNSDFISADLVELLESRSENFARQDKETGKPVLQDHSSEIALNAEEKQIVDGLTREERYNIEEKGKQVAEFLESGSKNLASQDEETGKKTASREQSGVISQEKAVGLFECYKIRGGPFFKVEYEEEIEVQVDNSTFDAKEEQKNSFDPFSAALKVVEDRKLLFSHNANFPWTPSMREPASFEIPAPSLQDQCVKVLSDNIEEVESLEGLPDSFMHKIAAQICRSGCMSSHILHLFIKGFPTKIYLSGGSWEFKGQIE
ncbi:hypothetical protein KSP39_PZI009430 [Platanthera zijinensis]|uniref:Uncharacterized protein n=1 Tax=Platanthera zijinensis TaxID=2320716 RepID=A0AAP0BMR4_9ASPA